MNGNNNLGRDLKLNVDLRTVPNLTCESCGNGLFKTVFVLKRLSPLITGQPKPVIVPTELFACEKCGHVNDEINPFRVIEDEKPKV